jgi:hypothetical protein
MMREWKPGRISLGKKFLRCFAKKKKKSLRCGQIFVLLEMRTFIDGETIGSQSN